MRTKVMIGALLAFSLAAIGADSAATSTAKLGQPAPSFTLEDQTGKPVSLSDYSGKIVVLGWLNEDCPFVQRHFNANTFNTIAAKYADKGVAFLGIDSSAKHTMADIQQTVHHYNLNFPLLSDAKGTVGHLYNAKTTPDMYVINKDGTLVYMGAIDNDPDGNSTHPLNYVDQALDEILAGKNVSTAETKSYGCFVKYAE